MPLLKTPPQQMKSLFWPHCMIDFLVHHFLCGNKWHQFVLDQQVEQDYLLFYSTFFMSEVYLRTESLAKCSFNTK